MEKRCVMAFDLGASNGRAIVGAYDGQSITLHEVHRFSNDPVKLGKHLYWDFPRLFHELKVALVQAKMDGFVVESIGIDSWGVDYGLIDENGNLMGNPVHYRDDRADAGMEMLMNSYDKDSLKRRTGMDCVSYNTVNQLINEDLLKGVSTPPVMLNIPDLFNYFLTGVRQSEYSMATTTQLYDYKTMDWNRALMDELMLSQSMFAKIVPSGTVVGQVNQHLLDELKLPPTKVVSVTSHDTAAAVGTVDSEDGIMFIATGTWLICGITSDQMIMNDAVMKYGLTNEGGRYPTVNLLKNQVGLWLLQESKRAWNKEGLDIGFAEMVQMAEEADIDSQIDIEDSRFYKPGDMPQKVADYCFETNQCVPQTIGEVVQVIEQSLAKQISITLEQLEETRDATFDRVHIFGGGVQDNLLCRLIGKYSGKEVVIGTQEGAAYGNVLDQFRALDVEVSI